MRNDMNNWAWVRCSDEDGEFTCRIPETGPGYRVLEGRASEEEALGLGFSLHLQGAETQAEERQGQGQGQD